MTNWMIDEQQVSYLRNVFDLTVHDEPIEITPADIDWDQSNTIGQNRREMVVDTETAEIIALYMEDGVTFPMPVVFKANPRAKRVSVLDGRHRLHASFKLREDPSVPAVLVTGETQVARRFSIVVNTLHGRTTRDPAYLAHAMRLLRESGTTLVTVAKMFGFSEAKVATITRRDAQQERLDRLLGRASARLQTLDILGQLEDDHVRILGQTFLDAPKAVQEDLIRELRAAKSADRDALAYHMLGRLEEAGKAKHKVKATQTRPATRLQDGLQRLVGVPDPRAAYYASTDNQQAIIRSNLDQVMPRLDPLWKSLDNRRRGGAT